MQGCFSPPGVRILSPFILHTYTGGDCFHSFIFHSFIFFTSFIILFFVHQTVHLSLFCLSFYIKQSTTSMPRSTTPGWIDWKTAPAREILLADLEPGGILNDRDDMSEELVWEFYRELPEFWKVVFDQFKKRLRDHRKQATSARVMAKRDKAALKHDRELFPRQKRNTKGELVFDLHPAKALLRRDIKNNLHEEMKPSALRRTKREYRAFKLRIFEHRVYQEVRRKKWFFYLDLQRAKLRSAPRRTTK
jgi:hypothetical protein